MAKENRLTIFPSTATMRRFQRIRFEAMQQSGLGFMPTATQCFDLIVEAFYMENCEHETRLGKQEYVDGASISEAEPTRTKKVSRRGVRQVR